MMREKKRERRRRPGAQRGASDITLGDSDDLVRVFVDNMKLAAADDRTANEIRQPALNKRKMLPLVINTVKKADLHEVFVDYGLMDAFSVRSGLVR